MIPRDFLNYFKTKTGRIILFGGLFAAALAIFSTLRKHHADADTATTVTPLATNAIDGKPQVVQSVVLPMQPFHPPLPTPVATPDTMAREKNQPSPATRGTPSASRQAVGSSPNPRPHKVEPLTPISLLANSTTGVPRPKPLSAAYAPFGRLIPCETVITVDSSSLQTPIIGLVTRNIYFAGRLLIPAGTEVHGMAQTDRQRDRIAASTSWTLVWQNGEEMHLKALALDREFDNHTNQSGWAITDGSAGLRGEILKSDNLADIKLFAATFLSGAASALTEKQQTVFGPINSPTLNNAPFQGAQAVLQTYAQQIYDSIKKNGFYVRVPSGKQFYLYVLQTIDLANASRGGQALQPVNLTGNQP